MTAYLRKMPDWLNNVTQHYRSRQHIFLRVASVCCELFHNTVQKTGKIKSAFKPNDPSGRSISGFCSMKRLRVFLIPLDGVLLHCTVTPSIKFSGTHLNTWMERGTVRVKCLAQEHNAMSPARARTRTARSGVERTNHEATALPTERKKEQGYSLVNRYTRKKPCTCL